MICTIPVISEEINIPVISEDNTNTTKQTNRHKRTIRPIQRLHPCVTHATNGMEPEKRKNKYLKGKKRNSDACDNTTATMLAHVNECYSKIGEEPARIIQVAQQLILNKGLKKFGKRVVMQRIKN